MGLTHAAVVVVADDPAYPVGTDEWNADHLFTGGAQHQLVFQGAANVLSSSSSLTWNDSTKVLTPAGTLAMAGNAITFTDSQLLRNAANVLELRGVTTTNAQAVLLDHTWTDASNYERGFLRWSSNVFRIGTEGLGTGAVTPRSVSIQPGSATFTFNSTGDFTLVGGDIIFGSGHQIYCTSGVSPTLFFQSAASSASFLFTLQAGAAQTNTSGGSTLLRVGQTSASSGFAPGSGTGSWAAIQVLPVVNGTSTGTAYGLGIASKTNTLTGGTIKLISAGTTTTDLFTGYTELFSVDIAGTTTAPVFKTSTALITAVDGGSTAAFTANMVGSTGGPTTAAQNGWVKMQDSTGATFWVAAFK